MTDRNDIPFAGLVTLILLQGTMLAALFAGVPPHPPEATPAFGIAPFIGAAISAAAAALCLGPARSRAGRILAGLAAVMALVSFGPQKYLDPQIALIWPAVLSGQIAALAIFAAILRPRAADPHATRAHVA
ncbi:hypothetical protein [Poseidonocella sedimentorum]|uniref:SPW repeat-containing protein n=1 Tax=Poseidonocella sedimentorum TaxID=871652 RepID=A0A1I6CT33_9RHOB|nr:hypothetical protein [Poseidonocella sedimentorum]SFQ96405.1 hypothetical protein SAMN04515673_101333 [Poseidonocella sedimentorum]